MTGAAVAKPGASLSGEGRDRLLAILGQFERLVVSDDMGGAFFRMLMAQNPDVEIISAGRINETSYPLRFDEFILKAGIMGAQAVVTVGGDGLPATRQRRSSGRPAGSPLPWESWASRPGLPTWDP